MNKYAYLITVSPADGDLGIWHGDDNDNNKCFKHFENYIYELHLSKWSEINKIVGCLEMKGEAVSRTHGHMVIEFNKFIRTDNLRRMVGRHFCLKEIQKHSVNIRTINGDKEAQYYTNLFRSVSYLLKNFGIIETDENEQAIRWQNWDENELLYAYGFTDIEMKEINEEAVKYKNQLNDLRYRALGKVNFFKELMACHLRHQEYGEMNYTLWMCLEELYKKGIWCKDLSPKQILNNFQFMKGETSELVGFKLSQFDI